jgi:hypothetical protein
MPEHNMRSRCPSARAFEDRSWVDRTLDWVNRRATQTLDHLETPARAPEPAGDHQVGEISAPSTVRRGRWE